MPVSRQCQDREVQGSGEKGTDWGNPSIMSPLVGGDADTVVRQEVPSELIDGHRVCSFRSLVWMPFSLVHMRDFAIIRLKAPTPALFYPWKDTSHTDLPFSSPCWIEVGETWS